MLLPAVLSARARMAAFARSIWDSERTPFDGGEALGLQFDHVGTEAEFLDGGQGAGEGVGFGGDGLGFCHGLLLGGGGRASCRNGRGIAGACPGAYPPTEKPLVFRLPRKGEVIRTRPSLLIGSCPRRGDPCGRPSSYDGVGRTNTGDHKGRPYGAGLGAAPTRAMPPSTATTSPVT